MVMLSATGEPQMTQHCTEAQGRSQWGRSVLLWYFCASVVCVDVAAQDVSVSATVTQRRVALGESIELQITANGTQDAQPPSVELDGFLVQYLGPSTYVSIVNGSVSSAITYVYSLLPKREGTFTIGPIPIRAAGQTLTTEPMIVEVLPSSARPSPAASWARRSRARA